MRGTQRRGRYCVLEDALDTLAQGGTVAQRGITVVAPAWLEQCVREGRFVPARAHGLQYMVRH